MVQQDRWKKHQADPLKRRSNSAAVRVWDLVAKNKPKTLLDIGCGRSYDPVYFVKKGLDVTATDISKRRLDVLRQYVQHRQITNIHCILSDTHDLKIKKEYFDVVYSHLSLHYFNQKSMEKIMDNIHSGLKKGGLFYIRCRSIEDPEFGKGRKIDERTFDKDGHLHVFFDKTYMESCLKQFNIIMIRKASGKYEGHDVISRYIEAVARK